MISPLPFELSCSPDCEFLMEGVVLSVFCFCSVNFLFLFCLFSDFKVDSPNISDSVTNLNVKVKLQTFFFQYIVYLLLVFVKVSFPPSVALSLSLAHPPLWGYHEVPPYFSKRMLFRKEITLVRLGTMKVKIFNRVRTIHLCL